MSWFIKSQVIERTIEDIAVDYGQGKEVPPEEETTLYNAINKAVLSNPKVSESMAIELGMTRDDLSTDIVGFVLNNLEPFDPSKSGLNTYVSMNTDNYIANVYKGIHRQKRMPSSGIQSLFDIVYEGTGEEPPVSLEETLPEDEPSIEESLIYEDIINKVKEDVKRRDDLAYRMLEMLLEGYTEQNVAEEVGISQPSLHRKKKEIIIPTIEKYF